MTERKGESDQPLIKMPLPLHLISEIWIDSIPARREGLRS